MSAPPLCVFISVKGEALVLKASLLALRRQTLPRRLWKWAALCRSFAQVCALREALLSLPPEKEKSAAIRPPFSPFHIFLLPRIDELKNQALSSQEAPYVFFMDEDLILSPDHLNNLLREWRRRPSLAALGGSYISDERLQLSGRVYNFVCNLWLKANLGFLLCGNMSFQAARLPLSDKSLRFRSFLPWGFGGEEAPFFLRLKALGLKAQKTKTLSARHLARHSWLDLINRARLHGRALSFLPPKTGPAEGARLFLAERGAPHVKLGALAYLLLVRLIRLKQRFFRLFRLLKRA